MLAWVWSVCRRGEEERACLGVAYLFSLLQRKLMMVQGHLIMAPILKLPRQHHSGSYPEELYNILFCHPPWIKAFITCWHSCPVLAGRRAPWESDEADNLLSCKAGLCDMAIAWQSALPCPALPAMPACLPHPTSPCHLSNPSAPHLRWQAACRREIAHSRWGKLF